MLKVLPVIGSSRPSAKCGEIFCQSIDEFTIMCNFCNLKMFDFDDFLLHFKNMHFSNGLLKTEQLNAPFDVQEEYNGTINSDEEFKQEEHLENMSHNSSDQDDDDVTNVTLMNWQSSFCNSVASADDAEDSDKEVPDGSRDDTDEDDYDPDMKTTKARNKRLRYGTTNETDTNKKSEDFICEQCSKSYKTLATLRSHIKRIHEGESEKDADGVTLQLHCSECEVEFNSVRALDSHQRQEHGGYKCPHCDKRYASKRQLNGHIFKHSGIKSFKCDLPDCGKAFYDKRSLNVHKRNTHCSFKKFICDICGYRCRIKESLRVHYRSHTGEKPYVCNICNRRFASSSLLKEHQPMHTSERPHKCEVCSAAFSRPKALYHHRFLHLSEKKFKCKLCDNAFAQLSGLAGHMRKHKDGLC